MTLSRNGKAPFQNLERKKGEMGKGETPAEFRIFQPKKKPFTTSPFQIWETPLSRFWKAKMVSKNQPFFDANIGRSSATAVVSTHKSSRWGKSAIDEMQLLHFNPFSHRHLHRHLVLMVLPLKPSAVATLPQTHHAISVPKWFSDGSPQLAPCRQ